jgi:hypothetical protein
VPVGIHTFGYLLLTALVALIVYEKLGVQILRRAWLNLDLIWAVALVPTGVLTCSSDRAPRQHRRLTSAFPGLVLRYSFGSILEPR